MTKRKCSPDCTCFNCLEAQADPNCAACGGDGYTVVSPGFLDIEEPCKCTEEKRLKKMEKAGWFRRTQEGERS